jgi:protein-S-isoprenylcysteine O-methyltransferase Ste14
VIRFWHNQGLGTLSDQRDHGMKNPFRFLLYVPVPWVFVLNYLLGAGLEQIHPRVISPQAAQMSTIAGAVLFAIGAVIAGWGLILFRKARTTTVPGRSSAQLVMSGPYRFTRNPMYVGLSLAYLGEAGLLRQLWPAILLPLTLAYVNWTVIPVEEAKLEEVFPDQYRDYCSRVRRWI